MSGRVHDLVTAENFAKWAEERKIIRMPARCAATWTDGCAVAQWLQSVGFPEANVGNTAWRETLKPESGCHLAIWMDDVTSAYDNGERSGPALAAIARRYAD